MRRICSAMATVWQPTPQESRSRAWACRPEPGMRAGMALLSRPAEQKHGSAAATGTEAQGHGLGFILSCSLIAAVAATGMPRVGEMNLLSHGISAAADGTRAQLSHAGVELHRRALADSSRPLSRSRIVQNCSVGGLLGIGKTSYTAYKSKRRG